MLSLTVCHSGRLLGKSAVFTPRKFFGGYAWSCVLAALERVRLHCVRLLPCDRLVASITTHGDATPPANDEAGPTGCDQDSGGSRPKGGKGETGECHQR